MSSICGQPVMLGSGGAGLNIAYGLTPPTDTTKLWVPLEKKPANVEISGESLQNAVETIETKVAVMPATRTAGAAAVVDGKIYILGGSPSTNSAGSNTIYEYDPETDTIVTKNAVLPLNLVFFDAVVINGKVYTFGGSSGQDNEQKLILEYNPVTDTVATKTAVLATNEFSVLAVAIGGKAYLFGGDSSTLIQEYDPETDTIVTKNAVLPLSTAARYGSAVAIGGKAYLNLPGRGIYEYDPVTDTLTDKFPTDIEIDYSCGTVAINGKMFLLGGGSSTSTTSLSNIIREYDPITNELTTKSVVLPRKMARAAAAEYGGTAYIFGGAATKVNGDIGTDLITNIYAYTPKAYLRANHLKLFASVYRSEEHQIVTNIVNGKKEQIKLYMTSAFLGDDDGYAKAQDAYVYNKETQAWQTLDGNSRASGVSLLGDAKLGDMVLGNGG